MFDVNSETKLKLIRLGKYVSEKVGPEEYEKFEKEVKELNERVLQLIDVAIGKDYVIKYPYYSEKEIEVIDYLYNKYILKKQETKQVIAKNDPEIHWDRDTQFTKIVSNMSREEFDRLCKEYSPLVITYIGAIYSGAGNPIDLRMIYFSEEDEKELQDLITKTLEKYGIKTEDKKIEESKEGGVIMEENKEVLTSEERISQKLSSEIEGKKIDVSPDVVAYFEEYVKELIRTNEKLDDDTPSIVKDVIYYMRNNNNEWPMQTIENIYPADARAVRDYMLAKYEERTEKLKYEERTEKLKDEITGKLGLSREEIDKRFRPDVTIEELEKANEQLNKKDKEDKKELANELLKRNNAEAKEINGENEGKWEPGESAEYDFGMQTSNTEPAKKDLAPEEKRSDAFQDPEVKAKMLMSRIEGLGPIVGKISDDKWPEVLRYLQGLANDNKENSSGTKEPIQETKQSFLARLKEKREEGRKIAVAKREAIQSEKVGCEQEMEKYSKSAHACSTRIGKLDTVIGVLEKALTERDGKISEIDKEIEMAEKRTNGLIKYEGQKRTRFGIFMHELFSKEDFTDEDIGKMITGEKEMPRRKGLIARFKEALTVAKKNPQSLDDYIAKLEARKDEIRSSVEYNKLEERIDQVKAEKNKCQKEWDVACDSMKKLQVKLDNLQVQLGKMARKSRALKDKPASMDR